MTVDIKSLWKSESLKWHQCISKDMQLFDKGETKLYYVNRQGRLCPSVDTLLKGYISFHLFEKVYENKAYNLKLWE